MKNHLVGLLRPVQIEDRARVRSTAVVALLSIFALLWPLTAIHADGMQARLTYVQQAEQSSPLEPEQVQFHHISPEDGLSEGRVWGITQDRRGFLWFTSMDGINRYDGREFRVYKYDPKNTNSPGSAVYRRVLEDSRGILWFGSLSEGLSRFDPETEQWTNYRHDPQDPNSLSGDAIWAIAEDQRGGLWIGTEANGLNRFDYDTGQFTRYQHDLDDPNSLSANQALAIVVDRSGAVWIGTQFGGLNRFDPESGQWTHYRHDPDDPHSLSHDHILSLFEDGSGTLWIGTWGAGLDRFDGNGSGEGTFSHYQHDPDDPSSLSNNLVAAIHQDRTGTLWVGTFGGGLNRLDLSDVEGSEPGTPDGPPAHFSRYQHDPENPDSLSHNMAVSILEDETGVMWIGTAGGGVNKLDLQPKPFTTYQQKPADPNSLSSSDVRAIYVDDAGDLWIGTYGGGLNRVERQAGSGPPTRVTHFRHDAADPSSLSSTNVTAIAEDKDGMLWIGTSGGGFNRFDRETETFVHYESDPASPGFRPAGIKAIYEDHSGVLWFGSWGKGLARLERETDQFKIYVHAPDDPHSLSGNAVFVIFEDSAGDLWIGTVANGLNRFDRESETFTHYRYDPADAHGLSHNMITAIHQDGHGDLWIGTGGGGLNRLDLNTESFDHYTEKDGLSSNTIHAILGDDDGLLWISTAGGLSRFDPRTGFFRNYTASDGLPGNQFNELAAYKSRDGELLFGGPNGLVAFYPQQIQDDSHVPPVALTDVRLNYQPVSIGPDSALKRSLTFADKLTLSLDDKVISFDFASLSYRAPEKNRCRYKLDGFDEGWTEVDSTQCSATYTNLGPGEYVFRVMGSNGDGVWNEEGTSMHVIVPPPWWQTWWFRGGLAVVLLGLLAGGYYWRLWRLERRARYLEAEVAQRTRDLRASEQEYRDLVENISEVIYAADSQGIVTYASPAIEPYIGYSPSEVVGRPFADFIVPEDLRLALAPFDQLSSGAPLTAQEFRVLTSAGEVRWAHASSQPVVEQDQVVGVRGVLTDVTERRQMEEQREQAAAAAERQRLARDLHDAVSQTLYSVAAIAEALPDVWARHPDQGRQGLQDLRRLTSSALAEMRTLLLELRPATLTEKPLGELLRQLVDAARGHTRIPITLTLTGECCFPPNVQIALYRIAQEGLNNIVKHARASRVVVGLYCQPGRATLGISDDGRGFEVHKINSGQLGLAIMRERAESIGAKFSIEIEPGQGTEITVTWTAPKGEVDAHTG